MININTTTTTREIRHALFVIDTMEANVLRRKLFDVCAQDEPAEASVIAEAGKILELTKRQIFGW
jgi:hypothetical protein